LPLIRESFFGGMFTGAPGKSKQTQETKQANQTIHAQSFLHERFS